MQIHSNIHGPTVAELRRKYRLNYFVETGTAGGDTTELAAIYFDRVFTCEIDEGLLARSIKRMAEYNNIDFYHMPSPDFLRHIKRQVSQPAMYWLDAHWCGGPVKLDRECPLLEELEIIGGLHGHTVVLIDDLQIMLEPPAPPHDPTHWPTVDDIHAKLSEWAGTVKTSIVQGQNSKIMVVEPVELAEHLKRRRL